MVVPVAVVPVADVVGTDEHGNDNSEPVLLVPAVAVRIVGESRGEGHGHYGQHGNRQEYDSTHALPPLSRVLFLLLYY